MNYLNLSLILLFSLVSFGKSTEKYFDFEAFYDQDFVNLFETSKNSHKSPIEIIYQSLSNQVVGKNVLTNKVCLDHLLKYKNSTEHIPFKETWAHQLMDSSGAVQPGWFSGNLINLGDFDQCLATKSLQFHGLYCWLQISFLGNKTQLYSLIPHNAPIIWTVCIPSSCKNEDLLNLMKPFAKTFNLSIQVTCQDERKGMSTWDIIALLFITVVLLIALTSTLFQKEATEDNRLSSVFYSFNLKRNVGILMITSRKDHILSSLHGLRFVCQCLIIAYHLLINFLLADYPVLNKFYLNEFSRSWMGVLGAQITLIVDIFFLLSGLLVTFNFLKKETKSFNLLQYYIHRYFRLTPPLLIVLLAHSTFVNRICVGPLCSMLLDKEQEICAKYWWTNALYINNFYPGILSSCMPHTWYLAADWQIFFFISPLVMYVLLHYPQYIFIFLGIILALSTSSMFLITYFYDLMTARLMIFDSPSVANDYYNKLYTPAYNRVGPWVIGAIFGIFLSNFSKKSFEIPQRLVILAWSVCIVTLFGCLFFDLPFVQPDYTYNPFWSFVYNSCSQHLWSLSICWIIFACGLKKGGIFSMFLCWPALQPLAKLSYSAYLIHKLLISLYFGEARTPTYFSLITQMPVCFGMIVISFMFALALYTCFEVPVIHLEAIFLSPDLEKSDKKENLCMEKNENESGI